MKTTLTFAFMVLVGFVLLGGVPAVAQGVAAPANGVADPAASLAAPGDISIPQAQQPQPVANAAPPQPVAADQNPAAQNSWLVDSGLWDGAAVGPCCSICGGGSACPPDWYTSQGVRILSRSKPRSVALSYQGAETGSYTLEEVGIGAFQVRNTSGSLIPIPVDHTTANSYTTNTNSNTERYPMEPAAGSKTTNVFNSKSMGFDVAGGYDMTIGHYFLRDRNNNDHFVEFTFWGLNSWSDSQSRTGSLVPTFDEDQLYSETQAIAMSQGLTTPLEVAGVFRGNLRTPFPTPVELPSLNTAQRVLSLVFNNGLEHTFSYRSAMNNFELNGRITPRGRPDRLVLHPDGRWRRECQPGTYMSYLYGLRFMQIDETFRFHSDGQGILYYDAVSGDPVVKNGVGDYDVVTHNSLLGLQIGADMTFRKCKWTWGITSKLGPYINFANQASTIDAALTNYVADEYHRRTSANSSEAALIGEVGIEATYKFRPNLMGRASYDLMWVAGLALAPEQLQFEVDQVNRVNVNGSIFSQGVSLGLEWLW